MPRLQFSQLTFFTVHEWRRRKRGAAGAWQRGEHPKEQWTSGPKPFEFRDITVVEWRGPDGQTEEVQREGWDQLDYLNHFGRDGWDLVVDVADARTVVTVHGNAETRPLRTRILLRRQVDA